MNMNEYQSLSTRTLPKNNQFDNLANYALGIVGESAEVADELKKVIYHGHDLNVDKLAEELGDVSHYLAGLCTMLDLSLEDVAKGNINKLKKRFPNGFNKEDSIKRADHD